MELLSREYGWLPSEIRNERWSDVEEYVQLIILRRKLEEAETKKHGR